MKKCAAFLCLITAGLMLAACGGHKAGGQGNGLVYGKPAWYWHPGDGELIGGVGESGLHLDGPSAQRQLAVSRAMEDIARQKGITVQNIQEITQYANREMSSVNISAYSLQTVDGAYIVARIREVWQDPATGRIFVWATEVK